MATQYDDLAARFDPDLYLRIDGVVYRVAAVDIEEAQRLSDLIWGPGRFELGPLEEMRECERILQRVPHDGQASAWDAMTANNIPGRWVYHAGRTALIHFGSGPQGAELGNGHWRLADLSTRIDVAKLLETLVAEQREAA